MCILTFKGVHAYTYSSMRWHTNKCVIHQRAAGVAYSCSGKNAHTFRTVHVNQ